jgi:hypothetical protein
MGKIVIGETSRFNEKIVTGEPSRKNFFPSRTEYTYIRIFFQHTNFSLGKFSEICLAEL